MKANLLLLSMLLTGAASATENPRPEDDRMELCITTGPCAIPARAKEIEETVYVVREQDYEALASLWTGATFFVTSDSDYQATKDLLAVETFIMPAVNPSGGVLERKGGAAPAPAPKPSGGPLIGGSISVGNITIGGGGAGCADCHTGSWKEIHGKVMKPSKPDNGK